MDENFIADVLLLNRILVELICHMLSRSAVPDLEYGAKVAGTQGARPAEFAGVKGTGMNVTDGNEGSDAIGEGTSRGRFQTTLRESTESELLLQGRV
jgi:hypothetical protein